MVWLREGPRFLAPLLLGFGLSATLVLVMSWLRHRTVRRVADGRWCGSLYLGVRRAAAIGLAAGSLVGIMIVGELRCRGWVVANTSIASAAGVFSYVIGPFLVFGGYFFLGGLLGVAMDRALARRGRAGGERFAATAALAVLGVAVLSVVVGTFVTVSAEGWRPRWDAIARILFVAGLDAAVTLVGAFFAGAIGAVGLRVTGKGRAAGS